MLSDDLDCHFFDSIDSTNLFLSNKPYSKKTQVCVTRQQSDGRGQYGRKWVSQKDGSILFSIRQNFIQEENLSGLSLIIGLAIIKVLENEYSFQGFFPWNLLRICLLLYFESILKINEYNLQGPKLL